MYLFPCMSRVPWQLKGKESFSETHAVVSRFLFIVAHSFHFTVLDKAAWSKYMY